MPLVCEGGLCEYVPDQQQQRPTRRSSAGSSSKAKKKNGIVSGGSDGNEDPNKVIVVPSQQEVEASNSTASPSLSVTSPTDKEDIRSSSDNDEQGGSSSNGENVNEDHDNVSSDDDDDDDEQQQHCSEDCSDENMDGSNLRNKQHNDGCGSGGGYDSNDDGNDSNDDDDRFYRLDSLKLNDLLRGNADDQQGCLPAMRRRLSNDGPDLPTASGVMSPPSNNSGAGTGAAATGFVIYNPYVVKMIVELNNAADDSSQNNEVQQAKKILDILNRLIYAVETDSLKYGSAIGFHGGIGAILTCMKHYKKSSKIQERSCHLLGMLNLDNPNHQIRVSENFGVTRILAAMTTFSNKPNLQREALWALSCVLPMEANAYQFTMNRGVNVVMKSLKQNLKTSPQIQLHGTTVLRLLSTVNGGHMMSCIDYPDVVTTVVQAMRHHKRLNKLQINGCAVLYALAREGKQDTQDALMKHDVIQLLLNCMNDNLEIAIIQCQCCSALRYLAQSRPEAREAMVRENAVTIIWDSLKVHPKDGNVQREGAKALQCLSKGPGTLGTEGEYDRQSDPSLTNSVKSDLPDCINDECYE